MEDEMISTEANRTKKPLDHLSILESNPDLVNPAAEPQFYTEELPTAIVKSWFTDDPADKSDTINPNIVWSKARSKFYSSRAARILSGPQIIFGLVAIITQSILLGAYMVYYQQFGTGIWCGVTFIVTGSIGLVAAKRQTLPWVITHLVMCIIVCIFAFLLVANSMLIVGSNPYYYDSGKMVCAMIMFFAGLASAVLSIVSSTLISAPMCCFADETTPDIYYPSVAEDKKQLIGSSSLDGGERKYAIPSISNQFQSA